MEPSPPYEDILEDETLAPLKRNHACLQCKKRKVKCDAVRPTCNPCMRSHAHALRSAARNKTRPPPLVCSYAEGDEDDDGLTPLEEIKAARLFSSQDAGRKRVSSVVTVSKRPVVGLDKIGRERDRRSDEERDTLKARIAELEQKLNALTAGGKETIPSGSIPSAPDSTSPECRPIAPSLYRGQSNYLGKPWAPPVELLDFDNDKSLNDPLFMGQAINTENSIPLDDFNFSNLLMLPANWPKNLPSPILLEHLIETYFNCEPQTPRMLHRSNLLARVKLPPSSEDFPFPGLLHAICAAAASHTAWTNNLPPEQLETSRMRHLSLGLDLENCEDFAMAQSEAAERCIRHGTVSCLFGPGQLVFDILRAHIILSEVYFNKGMPLRAWITGGVPGRLIKALELANRNVRKADKPSLMPEYSSDQEREERFATVWIAYMHDAGFSVNSAWSANLDLDEIRIPLPTSTEEFRQKFDQSGYMKPNPQTAMDPDVLVNHPMPDAFILVIKASFLLGRVAKWLREWQQRPIKPGDDMDGIESSSFIRLNAEIFAYQLSIPGALKNIYRILDSGSMTTFDANLLSVHILPHVAILLLHEGFVDWKGPETTSLRQMQKAFEAVVGFIHLIPSQLDITLVVTPLLVFSLYTVGRFIAKFVHRAIDSQQFALAMRWRTDLSAIQSVLNRHGAKHSLGLMMATFLENYMQASTEKERLQLESCSRDSKSTPSTTWSASDFDPMLDIGGSSMRSSTASGSGQSPAIASLPSSNQTPESIDQNNAFAAVPNSAGQGPGIPHTLDTPVGSFNPFLLAEFLDQSSGVPDSQLPSKTVSSEAFVDSLLSHETYAWNAHLRG